MRTLPIVLCLLAPLAISCGDDDGSRVCDPGAVQRCPCIGGGEGVQTCADDGSRWLECECGGRDAGEDAGSDAASDVRDDANDAAMPTPRPVDVLVVLDDSAGMTEEQDIFAASFEGFLQGLIAPTGAETAVEDLHVGLVTTDLGSGGFIGCTEVGNDGVLQNSGDGPGCLESYWAADCAPDICPWLLHSEEHPNDGDEPIWDDFTCISEIGTGGCGYEQPLESFARALGDRSGLGEPNAGFLRDDSVLVLVIVTDEDDCSASDPTLFNPARDDLGPLNVRCAIATGLLHPVSRFETALRTLRPEGDLVVALIGGIPIDGSWNPGDSVEDLEDLVRVNPGNPNELVHVCDGPRGSADPSARLVDFAYRFGDDGLVASICTEDYDSVMAALADRVRVHLLP